MTSDPFTDRLARVRARFASTLTGKIDDTRASITGLSDAAPGGAQSVAEAYRRIHGIVGVGPTVGFPQSGAAAHEVEQILRAAQQRQRGLTDEEIAQLKANLELLRDVAGRELQSIGSIQATTG